MSFFYTIKQGQKYAETWVMNSKLAAIFPENRIIKTTKFAQKLMPFIAVFAVVWQQFASKGNESAFAIAILTALFALGIPFQGLYWLGKRAKTALSAQSRIKFQQISQQLAQKNIQVKALDSPTYQDLADLLRQAERHLGSEFWNDI